MKKIKITEKRLYDMIDTYSKNKKRSAVVYFDIVNKEQFDTMDINMQKMIADHDKCFPINEKYYFLRDTSPECFKTMKEEIDKCKIKGTNINDIIPLSLIDMEDNIEYKYDYEL